MKSQSTAEEQVTATTWAEQTRLQLPKQFGSLTISSG